MNTEYYDILNVDKNANQDTIKKSWRKLCIKYHPDKVANENIETRENAEKRIKDINEAYSVLSDPKKREIYDNFGKQGLHDNQSDNTNIFGNNNPSVPPLIIKAKITLDQLYNGYTLNNNVKRVTLCKVCDFTGAKNKQQSNCQKCYGRGNIIQILHTNMGITQTQYQCPDCMGKGFAKDTVLCDFCNGQKAYEELYELNLKIDKNTMVGDKIILEKCGHEMGLIPDHSGNTSVRGDIIINITVLPHEIFEKSNNNLKVKIHISLCEALLGTKNYLTHLDGRNLLIVEDNIIKPGELKIIRNEGLTSNSDLIIEYIVDFPDYLSDEQKLLIGNIFNSPGLIISPDTYTIVHSVPFIENFNNDNNNNDIPRNQCVLQ